MAFHILPLEAAWEEGHREKYTFAICGKRIRNNDRGDGDDYRNLSLFMQGHRTGIMCPDCYAKMKEANLP
ncbi:MAG: hypothetical protein OXC18_19145 [Desulfurellaceae bacterium]|nr:hypothetical protein [Desulfurellaceae bacterium]